MVECLCCGYDTLDPPHPRSYETCFLCWWEDDGQDDYDAHRVIGGPNSDYSLLEARNNFKKYLLMFRPSDPLFRKFKNDGIDDIKQKIMLLFDDKQKITNEDELIMIESQILNLRETLWEEEQKKIKKVEKHGI